MATKHICPNPVFVPEYTHYITKKVMRAVDYGYRAWFFCGCTKNKKK